MGFQGIAYAPRKVTPGAVGAGPSGLVGVGATGEAPASDCGVTRVRNVVLADGGVLVEAGQHNPVAVETDKLAALNGGARRPLEEQRAHPLERPVSPARWRVWVEVSVRRAGKRQPLEATAARTTGRYDLERSAAAAPHTV